MTTNLEPRQQSAQPSQSVSLLLLLLILMIAPVYTYTAVFMAIADDGDALYATVAREMLERDDWVTPYANGVRFFDKPPLMYWLMAGFSALLGGGEFAVRFPSVLAVVGTAWLVFLLGRMTGDPRAGFAAGAGFALCVGTFLFTRESFPDIYFVFFLTLSMFGFLKWYRNERGPLLPAMVFYTSMAGAVLAKGLIGLAFPLIIVTLFLVVARPRARLGGAHVVVGTVFFLAFAVPWHLLVAWRNDGFLWWYFVNEHFLRFLGRREPVDYTSISLPVFWGLILVWLFPWSAFFPAIRHLPRIIRDDGNGRRSVVVLALLWTGFVLGFFSISSRIEHYSLPLLPPLALLVGVALFSRADTNALPDPRLERTITRGFRFIAVIGPLVAVGLAGAIVWLTRLPPDEQAARAGIHAYAHFFGPLFDLPQATIRGFLGPLLATCLGLTLGTLGAWWLDRKGRRLGAVLSLSIMTVVFMLAADRSMIVCEGILSSKHFALELERLYQSGDTVVNVGDFETANSVNFYARTRLMTYRGTAAVLSSGLRYADAPQVTISREGLERRWNSTQRTFLLVPDTEIAELPITPTIVVTRSNGRTLFSNHPVIPAEPQSSRRKQP